MSLRFTKRVSEHLNSADFSTCRYIDTSHNVGWLIATHEAERYGASIDNGIKISPGHAYYINLDTMIVSFAKLQVRTIRFNACFIGASSKL